MEDIKSKHISIVGAARSGVAAARLCKRLGAVPFVTDSSGKLHGSKFEEILVSEGIAHELGAHSEKALDADLVVVSPGVPSDASILNDAHSKKIEVISELEFASMFYCGKVVAVTGSNGKTTTTSILGEIFKAAGESHFVAGNIGYAFSDGVGDNPDARYAILEVSSFQLDHIRAFKPDVAIITNITPDHLDRYNGNMDEYVAAKRKVYLHQSDSDSLIYNHDDNRSAEYITGAISKTIPCSVVRELAVGGCLVNDSLVVTVDSSTTERLVALSELKLKGPHNYMNILMAAVAAFQCGISLDGIRQGVTGFAGVEHRLEHVRTLHGVEWYNDSKATNVDSTITALRSFVGGVILIAGGKDKGAPYTPLAELVRERVRTIILIGEAAPKIANDLSGLTAIEYAEDLQTAVEKAHALAEEGNTVLLSPACASFDMFDNYEQRGDIFKSEVMGLS